MSIQQVLASMTVLIMFSVAAEARETVWCQFHWSTNIEQDVRGWHLSPIMKSVRNREAARLLRRPTVQARVAGDPGDTCQLNHPENRFFNARFSKKDFEMLRDGRFPDCSDFNVVVTCTNRLRDLQSSVCSEGSTQGDGTLHPVGLHFVVLSNPSPDPEEYPELGARESRMPTATTTHTHPITGELVDQSSDSSTYFRAEVELINSRFHDYSNQQICDREDCLSFEYAGHTLYSNKFADSCSALFKLGNPPNEKWTRDCGSTCGEDSVTTNGLNDGWGETFRKAFQECEDARLRKPGVVNFYVLDQCNWDSSATGGLSDDSCRRTISNGSNHPNYYVAAAYERMFRGPTTGDEFDAGGLEQHELGHVLGLGHVWDGCGRHTNAMHKGLGFTTDQTTGTVFPPSACGRPVPICLGNSDRLKGFSTAIEPYDYDDRCTEVNQITMMIEKARAAQRYWECP